MSEQDMTEQDPIHEIDPALLDILVCPVTHAPLHLDAKKRELVSKKAKLAFPVRDGIPILLPEEARSLKS